jgi:hypothetical protein
MSNKITNEKLRLISKLPENEFHVSRLHIFQVNNCISPIFVFLRIPGKQSGKVSGANGQDELVCVEVYGSAG